MMEITLPLWLSSILIATIHAAAILAPDPCSSFTTEQLCSPHDLSGSCSYKRPIDCDQVWQSTEDIQRHHRHPSLDHGRSLPSDLGHAGYLGGLGHRSLHLEGLPDHHEELVDFSEADHFGEHDLSLRDHEERHSGENRHLGENRHSGEENRHSGEENRHSEENHSFGADHHVDHEVSSAEHLDQHPHAGIEHHSGEHLHSPEVHLLHRWQARDHSGEGQHSREHNRSEDDHFSSENHRTDSDNPSVSNQHSGEADQRSGSEHPSGDDHHFGDDRHSRVDHHPGLEHHHLKNDHHFENNHHPERALPVDGDHHSDSPHVSYDHAGGGHTGLHIHLDADRLGQHVAFSSEQQANHGASSGEHGDHHEHLDGFHQGGHKHSSGEHHRESDHGHHEDHEPSSGGQQGSNDSSGGHVDTEFSSDEHVEHRYTTGVRIEHSFSTGAHGEHSVHSESVGFGGSSGLGELPKVNGTPLKIRFQSAGDPASSNNSSLEPRGRPGKEPREKQEKSPERTKTPVIRFQSAVDPRRSKREKPRAQPDKEAWGESKNSPKKQSASTTIWKAGPTQQSAGARVTSTAPSSEEFFEMAPGAAEKPGEHPPTPWGHSGRPNSTTTRAGVSSSQSSVGEDDDRDLLSTTPSPSRTYEDPSEAPKAKLESNSNEPFFSRIRMRVRSSKFKTNNSTVVGSPDAESVSTTTTAA